MLIRRADEGDLKGINELLKQVLNVHNAVRPDIFKADSKKYTDAELLEIIKDDERPIFVAVEKFDVLGYTFCCTKRHIDNNILTDIKTLYVDDLCVAESSRGKGIGTKLYEYVLSFAKEIGCYNLTLNVWALNKKALLFYESKGLVPQKIGLEMIL